MKFPFPSKHPLDLEPNVPKLSLIRQFSRRFLPFTLLVLLSLPALASASQGVVGNIIPDADFEDPANNRWFSQGQWVFIEDCCGQHETPYWGRNNFYDDDRYDGGMDPANQFTRLYHNTTINSSATWRLSTWAMTSGMRADLRAYLPGRTIDCGNISTSTMTPLSCEFAASNGESIMAAYEGNSTSGQWAVSDDWTLARLIQPGRIGWPVWTSLPVKYYVDTYATRTDMAAWSWNDSVGKQLLIRTSDINQAKIKFNAQYFNNPEWIARTWAPDANGVIVIDVDRTDVDIWSSSYSYGLDARQSVFAHELGHALGLNELYTSCDLMNTSQIHSAWYCGTFRPTSVDVTAVRGIYP